MATYAIGDLQGCYSAFQKLLDLVSFDVTRDKLLLVGDIVNRGPDSLSTLRFVKELGDAAVMVLGNHDLHLIMVAAGLTKVRSGDTLQPILNAPDCDELIDWLRHQKLLHVESDYVMVHAGLLPDWSVMQAAQLAQEVETVLRKKDYQTVFSQLYGNEPNYWKEDRTGHARLRVIINAMTRMRICTAEGRMDFSYKGNRKAIPGGYLPWFEVPHRASKVATVICGHWSTLGLNIKDNLIALDSGCLWGGRLTAMCLEDRSVFQVPCAQQAVKVH